jgi:hypothetical protein
MTSETSSETSSEVGASPTSEEEWVNPFPVPREPGHQVPRTFERQEAGTHVQIKLANEEFGQRMDVQEMMMKVMQATICSCPEDPPQISQSKVIAGAASTCITFDSLWFVSRFCCCPTELFSWFHSTKAS